jgi:amino acid adenylation domain-containing protein
MTARLSDYVTTQAQRRPDATAIDANGSRLSYGELDARSNQIARQLRDAGCRPGDRVCLLSPKTAAAIAAIVGIYKAGCIYVPLDPASPASRLYKIASASEPAALLLTPQAARLADEILGIDDNVRPVVGSLDDAVAGVHVRSRFTWADVGRQPSSPVEAGCTDADAAHILFTSGSTGHPKGVLITHASVARFIEWANAYFDVQSDDRVSGHSPLAFDLSVYDIFGTFAAGAALYPVPPELNVFPNKLAQFIRERELTQWFSAPSVLSYMTQFDVVGFGDFPALRRVIWCGEVFGTAPLRYWMTRIPHATFTNLYGPTEATIASSYFRVERCPAEGAPPAPIGRACPGEELLILDESLNEVADGELGEICIAGVGVSPGYWGAPDLTAAAFLEWVDPSGAVRRIYRTGDLGRRSAADGLIHFAGRRDSQVKSRGHRIELGEIESALQLLPVLRESAVVAVTTEDFGGTVVCCAYVPRSGIAVTPAQLRRELAALVPAYMLPSQWKAFDRLPLNGNGKTDRNVLKRSFLEGAVSAALTH